VLTLLGVAAVAVLSYGYILRLSFTGSDALYLIETSRIGSWRDLQGVFGSGIMGGEFYRPVAQLSYGVDYALCRTRPAGYHLTDLWLHLAVTLQLTLLARRWGAPGGWIGAGLTGLLFTLHPVLVESVPAVARRHDLLAGALGLSALLLDERADHDVRSLPGITALFLGLLALGSKEIAVLVPSLVVLGSWRAFLRRRHHTLWRPLSTTLAWGAATALFLIWRQARGAIGANVGAALAQPGEMWAAAAGYVSLLLSPFAAPGAALRGALAAAVVPLLAGVLLFGLLRPRWPRCYPLGGAWVLGGGLVLALTRRPDPRNVYVPAAGMALLVGGALAGLGVALWSGEKGRQRWLALAAAAPLLAVASGWLVASPLFNAYPGWRTGSALTAHVLEMAGDAADLLPARSTLYLINLPKAVRSSPSELHERSVSVMRDHSVQSWLDMSRPDRDVQVVVCSYRDVLSGQTAPPLIAYYYGDAAAVVAATKPEERDVAWRYLWTDTCEAALPKPERSVRPRLPATARAVDARLGDGLALEGYRLSRRAVDGGQTLSVMLYWRAGRTVEKSYTGFVHLLDEAGALQAQHDGLPVSGTYATGQWPAGALVADGRAIVVDPATPSGRYTLVAGMYDPETTKRLPAFRGNGERWPGDAVVLDQIRIRPSR
jgi:hypothetical protein